MEYLTDDSLSDEKVLELLIKDRDRLQEIINTTSPEDEANIAARSELNDLVFLLKKKIKRSTKGLFRFVK